MSVDITHEVSNAVFLFSKFYESGFGEMKIFLAFLCNLSNIFILYILSFVFLSGIHLILLKWELLRFIYDSYLTHQFYVTQVARIAAKLPDIFLLLRLIA